VKENRAMSTTTRAPDVSTAAGLLRLGNLFCDSKALLTAVQLDLFTALHERPATVEEIRDRLGLHGRGLPDFLRLLVCVGVLEVDSARYRNAQGADRHLVRGLPGYVGGFLQGSDINLYPVYGRLADALRTGKPQADGDFLGLLDNEEALGHFVGMMDGLTGQFADELVNALDWTQYRSVLDIGGCRGNVATRIVGTSPGLVGHVFDMPQLEPFFHEKMAETGLAHRIQFHPGNFFTDPLPVADVMQYGHILSDWAPEQREFLVSKAFDALPPGGLLLIYDRMLTGGIEDVENVVASLNMLLVTEGGGEYTVGEISDVARTAGFDEITHRPLHEHDTLVICRKA
jgi:8-O-methyltransferase